MKIVFIHQNMPGQYKHLAARLAENDGNQVVFITRRKNVEIPRVRKILYETTRAPNPQIHPYLFRTEDAVLHGQAVVRVLMDLRRDQFIPDIIIGHPGWGEMFFVKDIFPTVPVLSYCEFYYRARGADMDFDPSAPPEVDSILRARARSTHLLHALESCDQGIAPMQWQRSVHPAIYHDKINVVHDGIDTNTLRPDENASFTLPNGEVLTRHDEVVTYVGRNLEPYRGFPSMMRALPHILEARPNARVLIVGGDEISYGSGPKDAPNWREKMLAEVPVDTSRVHFLGRIPYGPFINMLRISAAHIYLTYPFVLSWSMLESMSLGCVVVGSRSKPVEEVIRDGENGLLVDFFNPEEIARRVVDVLSDRSSFVPISQNARRTVVRKYDLALCLKKQMEIINSMTRKGR